MRKFITLFMTLVLFGLFSGSALADKVEVCEDIKYDPAYKGLYGLCVAYWNADEQSRPGILENFYKKGGPDGPGMPGLDEPEPELVCPCWAEGQIDLGMDPIGCFVSGDYLGATYDDGLVQYEVGGFGVNSCLYANFTTDPTTFTLVSQMYGDEVTEEQIAVCASDLMERIVDDFGGCL